MAKKFKKQIKTNKPVPEKIPEVKKSIVAPKQQQNIAAQSFLIRFDKKTKIFLLIVVGLYFILSLLKIHTSNIGNWDLYFGKPESESVIVGKPRFIRMDEWCVSTPAVLSQYQAGMPLSNPSVGGENAPLVMGLPVKDVSSLLRPVIWSYFIFDEERAFAFSWNFNIFICILSFFLLFMLLTRNNFWLSIFGSLFIFFSSAIQWWSYTIGIDMMYLNCMVISIVYILYSKKLLSLIFAGVFFLFSANFLFILYPAFQVPLIYLYLVIFIGFLWNRRNFSSIKEKVLLRISVLSIAIIIMGILLYHYYHLVKDTYSVMLNTVYPGKRFSTGGDLVKGKFFADFFGMFMTDTNLPKQWLNICEASGFIMVFPIIFYFLGYQYFKFKKIDPLLLFLSLFIIVGSVYVLIGLPSFLSKLSLLSMTTSYRALPILGAGNAVLLICFLGSKRIEQNQAKFSWTEFGILAVSVIIIIRIICGYMNDVTDNFFTSSQITIATFLVAVVYLAIRYKYFRFAKPVLYGALGIMTISNVGVNPVTVGLSAVTENPLSKISKEIHDKDPKARWVIYDNQGGQSPRIASLLETNGISTFNGIKFVPPLKEMRVLDPSGIYDSVYNRYAWVSVQAYANGTDTVIFRQSFNDAYTIQMDPCSPRFKTLGVKYIVFLYQPRDAEIRCMTKMGEAIGMYIYKRNDE